MTRLVLTGLAVFLIAGFTDLTGAGAQEKVKVYILAGQSNMEGKAPNALLNHQATDEKTSDLFKHLRKDGKDVYKRQA